ncbi:MAG: RtcB family protein [Deltaproteobacteria bacterium]|nr:RtcB family protein [Deltaproteobacteria bacterium]
MKWVKNEDNYRVPIKSWCGEIEDGALKQAEDLAKHPAIFKHVALMPDCHQGYGMPIGGVIACEDAVIPNAVGVDIGCGMGAVKTDLPVTETSRELIRQIVTRVKELVPCGEGKAHKKKQDWNGFDEKIENPQDRKWYSEHIWKLANRNLGTLGGGNHFIELQEGDDGYVWLMIHSGSRNLGYQIARYYNQVAMSLNDKLKSKIPNKDLAFLPLSSKEGKAYITDMNFALDYAKENRRRIMESFKEALSESFPDTEFECPINIHHNYAGIENHFGKNVWVHRKGATSARTNEAGIIPGSMGSPSYIVEGLGSSDSFTSCSHGAGRAMGRNEASRRLSVEECNEAMEGIVFDRWNKVRHGKEKGSHDLGEAPQAYKDIDTVIESELDLIKPLVKLRPLGVVKG